MPDNLDVIEKTQIASWISVAMLPLCIFILISYAVLAPKWTNRHYTNIPLTAGIALMEVGDRRARLSYILMNRSH